MIVQPLKGFRDYGPEEMLARDRMIDKVRSVFESFGYAPIHTPALEYAQLLMGKYGEEGEKLLYRFLDNGGRDVALRYDLTVPLARFIATHPEIRFPFRRYHVAPVWRAERPQKGRFREFYQCDVDLLGVNSAAADAECILVDVSVMEALGLQGYRVCVNHRGFLDGLLRASGVTPAQQVSVLRILDKVDKIDREAMASQLMGEGLNEASVARLAGLREIAGTTAERLEAGRRLVGDDVAGTQALARLEEVLGIVERAHPGAGVEFNPSVARGLDYYTGVVFETFLPAEYGVGSVMSGGRYDGLIGMFSGRDVPAVGISLGLDRLVSALEQRGDKAVGGVTQVLVCTPSGMESMAAVVAHGLRRALGGRGVGVELFPEPVKLKKQLDYGNRQGVRFLVIPGPSEMERGAVMLKDMVNGSQEEVPLAELSQRVQERIKA